MPYSNRIICLTSNSIPSPFFIKKIQRSEIDSFSFHLRQTGRQAYSQTRDYRRAYLFCFVFFLKKTIDPKVFICDRFSCLMFIQLKLHETVSSAQIYIENTSRSYFSEDIRSTLKQIFMCFLKKDSEAMVAQRANEELLFLRGHLVVSLLGFTVGRNLTPISNVVKISEHFLLLF